MNLRKNRNVWNILSFQDIESVFVFEYILFLESDRNRSVVGPTKRPPLNACTLYLPMIERMFISSDRVLVSAKILFVYFFVFLRFLYSETV